MDIVDRLLGKPEPVPSEPLRDYLFIDGRRIAAFVDQLGGLPAQRKKQTRKLSGSLKGPSAEITVEEIADSGSDFDRISFLLQQLGKNGLMQTSRPVSMTQWGGPPVSFVLEEFEATPVTIRAGALAEELGAATIRVWVSDPGEAPGSPGKFEGSFLFLVEALHAADGSLSIHSGCSALRLLANSIEGLPPLDRSGPDPFGRDSDEHPIAKLARLDAVVGDPRRLQSLYTIRYMTNEQCYQSASGERRVHDILAYPLFIRTA